MSGLGRESRTASCFRPSSSLFRCPVPKGVQAQGRKITPRNEEQKFIYSKALKYAPYPLRGYSDDVFSIAVL